MPASTGFVSAPDRGPARTGGVLVCAMNWLGDSVMSLPALRAFRLARPGERIVLLAKRKLVDFWRLCPDADEVIELPGSLIGMIRLARRLREAGFSDALVLPNSFRSALTPFLARIPRRAGFRGHARSWMLTRVVEPPANPARRHQCHEMAAIFGVEDRELAPPRLAPPESAEARARELLPGAGARWAALLPGAARGSSKRWPAASFVEVGCRLRDELSCRVAVLGSGEEADVCGYVAASIGPGAESLAGRTSLPELAAVMSRCAVVVANDSGGMHLASAVDAPVVALFGGTDPSRTGPLHARAVTLQAAANGRRDIARRSRAAGRALRSIKPDQVLDAARRVMSQAGPMA